MVPERQKIGRPSVTLIEVSLAGALLGIGGIRLTSVLILSFLALLYLAYPIYRRPRVLLVGCVAYIFSFVVPIDVSLDGFTGRHYGSTHSGPRLVRSAPTGLTMHSSLRQKYGEYATHMASGGPFGIRWVFVWD